MQKFVECNVEIVFYYVFNYSFKTQVSVTTRTHASSQLSH